MFVALDYVTPTKRYNAWKKYKDLVDAEVKRLEKLHDEALKKNSADKEEIREVLNDIYQTQFRLDHMLI